MDVNFFRRNSYQISKLITKNYSTSFSLATSMLNKDTKAAIYAIYGFVRLADEVVDSFNGFDKKYLLEKLVTDLDYALEHKISTNVLLMSFADTVEKYNIDRNHIDAFMKSMEWDLSKTEYSSTEEIAQYIYGSADVVGLMCLQIFCKGNQQTYQELEAPARKLGSAFQKINFLRDLKKDKEELGRAYFPEMVNNQFDKETKTKIEKTIEKEFNEAFLGIKELPGRSKLAVGLAYYYYLALFKKIRYLPPEAIINKRIRISNLRKYWLILKTSIKYFLRFI